jgi:beta-N-acetylhexosaminidase
MTYIISVIIALILCALFPTPLHHVDVTMIPEPIPIKTHELSIEEKILYQMTDEQKVGQLFIFGFDGTTLTKENKQFLKETKVGGVLLLSKNISSESQLKKLITDIQSINKIPLFITIDQEGGDVARIRWDNKLTKAQYSINTTQEAYSDALYKGEYLKDIGINMNFAPVVEYINDKKLFLYDRVYRGTKEQIIQKSIYAINGYNKAEIVAVPKHYPGHGNSSIDSHDDLPTVNINSKDWNEYIEPFSILLEETSVDALMVGHVKYPNIDHSYPSSLSSEIINQKLITDLNYKGLVISDDMEMGALEDLDTYSKLAKRALEAGNDILIYSKYMNRHPNVQNDVYEYILNEVEQGNMNIDQKVLKIIRIKIKYSIL